MIIPMLWTYSESISKTLEFGASLQPSPIEKVKEKKIDYKIIKGQNNSWGYDILIDNKPYIHQTTIPSQAGLNGFKTKKDAEKVAKRVIEKIKNGENPPTITKIELINLKIIK